MATPSQRKKTLTVPTPARESVPVKLGTVVYDVSRPKSMLSLEMAQMSGNIDTSDSESVTRAFEAIDSLIEGLFGDKADAVRARLRDPKDALDVPEIMQVVKVVSEHFATVPTT